MRYINREKADNIALFDAGGERVILVDAAKINAAKIDIAQSLDWAVGLWGAEDMALEWRVEKLAAGLHRMAANVVELAAMLKTIGASNE